MSPSGSESFHSKLRLIRSRDFQQVFQKNNRFADAYLTILVGSGNGQHPRLGFAISKKQVSKAVKRNTIKRLVRESFRRQQGRLPARDMVVMVRRNILQLDNAGIYASLDKQWNRIISHAKNSDPADPSLPVSDQSTASQ